MDSRYLRNAFMYVKTATCVFILLGAVFGCAGPGGSSYEQVRQHEENLAFKHAAKIGTPKAWNTFLEHHPYSRLHAKAEVRWQKSVFRDAMRVDRIPRLLAALSVYPKKDPHESKIRDAILARARATRSIWGYSVYLARWPKGPGAAEARRALKPPASVEESDRESIAQLINDQDPVKAAYAAHALFNTTTDLTELPVTEATPYLLVLAATDHTRLKWVGVPLGVPANQYYNPWAPGTPTSPSTEALNALNALAVYDDAQAALKVALYDDNLKIGAIAQRLLLKHEVVPLVQGILHDTGPVRDWRAAVADLGVYRQKALSRPLAQALLSYYHSAHTTSLGLRSTAELRVIALAAALHDKDWQVRKAAALSLGTIGSKDCIVPLLQALRDAHPSVRAAAAYALGDAGRPAGYSALYASLSDYNTDVRRKAAKALVRLGWKPANQMQRVHWLWAVGKWTDLAKEGPAAVTLVQTKVTSSNPCTAAAARYVLSLVRGRSRAHTLPTTQVAIPREIEKPHVVTPNKRTKDERAAITVAYLKYYYQEFRRKHPAAYWRYTNGKNKHHANGKYVYDMLGVVETNRDIGRHHQWAFPTLPDAGPDAYFVKRSNHGTGEYERVEAEKKSGFSLAPAVKCAVGRMFTQAGAEDNPYIARHGIVLVVTPEMKNFSFLQLIIAAAKHDGLDPYHVQFLRPSYLPLCRFERPADFSERAERTQYSRSLVIRGWGNLFIEKAPYIPVYADFDAKVTNVVDKGKTLVVRLKSSAHKKAWISGVVATHLARGGFVRKGSLVAIRLNPAYRPAHDR